MPERRGKAEPDAELGELERGRACYARRAWAEAYAALAAADAIAKLGLEDLEHLAWSAGLIGRDDDLLQTQERLYRENLEAESPAEAARWAFWTGFRLFARGEIGQANAWLARAQRLVEHAAQDSVVLGYLRIPAAHRHLRAHEYEAAATAAAEAFAIGERCAERDLAALARNLQGRALLAQGRIAEGLAWLDEAMLAAASGELSPLVTGLVYCNVIAGCQQVYAFDRMREWTDALDQFCSAQPELVLFTGACQVHRSEIMQLGGNWPEAIAAARRVAERPQRAPERGASADAFYQQAEIHRLRGESAAAENAYASANELGRDPQPGLALLRLAQGRGDDALHAIRRAANSTQDRLQRTRFAPAYVEIALGLGKLDEARAAYNELETIAAVFDSDVLQAITAHARGALGLAEGDAHAALEPLRGSLAVWQRLEAPYFGARIRVLLGRAYRALGDADGARLESALAREVFERLGAAPDLAALAREGQRGDQKEASARAEHGLSARELEVLRLVAAGKTNRVIASELGLSEKTVDRHLSNIFGKLDVSSRAAATAYAYQHALVARD